MSLKGTQVAVGTAAAQVLAGSGQGMMDARRAFVTNTGANTCYLGGDATLTAANGFALPINVAVGPIFLRGDEPLWAICAGGQTATLTILADRS